MMRLRMLGLACLVALFAAVLPRGAAAQDHVAVDFRGGVAVPTGALADAEDLGPAFTIGLNIGLMPRVAIRVSGGADILKGTDLSIGRKAPDLSFTHLDAGVLVHLMDPASESRFKADLNVGGGISVLTSGRETYSTVVNGTPGTVIVDYSKLYPGATAGLLLGYQLAPKVDVFVSAQGNLTLAKKDDPNSVNLGLIAPETQPLGTVFSFPISAGLRFNFQP